MNKSEVIAEEQSYFDLARAARELSLQRGDMGPDAAANPKAAGMLNQAAKRRRNQVDPKRSVAEISYQLDDGEVFYVGKHAIFDSDSELLVIPWQSEAAGKFYRASAQDPQGVHRSRHFETTNNRIQDFEDIILADLRRRIEELDAPEPSFNDPLLRDLERDRTGEMHNIVKTIQSAQYELIQAPLDQLLIIQGGPGTGKTAIALHRVSYLLFNHSELRDQDVLVVGPNPTFSRYIKDLLPDLGDVDVVQSNLTALGPLDSDRRKEPTEVSALKGSLRMVDFLSRGLASRIRPPKGEDDDFLVNTRAGTIRIPSDEVRSAIANARRQRTYAIGRSDLRTAIAESLATRSRGTLGATAQQIDSTVERIWPSLTAASFLRELFGSKDRLLAAAGADFNAQEVGALYRQSAERIGDETWTDADIPLLDEAESLINGSEERFLHVVVDEAQDLSPMQMRSLRRRSNGSMTIVGDLAQSTGPFARDSWEEIVQGLAQLMPARQEELQYGYRVPRQVMDLASRLLPLAAPEVSAPRVIRDAPSEPEFLQEDPLFHAGHAVAAARDYAGRGLSVGVVIPDSIRHEVIQEFDEDDVRWRDANAGALGSGINLVSAAESKGLEFDAVVVVSPEEIAAESYGHRLLYIALTRTTRYLTVVYAHDPLALYVSEPQAPEWEEAPGVSQLPSVPDAGTSDQESQSPTRRVNRLQEAAALAIATELASEVRETIPREFWLDVWEAMGHQLNNWTDKSH